MHIRRSFRRALTAAAVLPALLLCGSPARAHQGGDPTDLDSCYGRCGKERGAGGLRCACDAACMANGDCCQDRHEWCAPAAVQPVCSLVDDSKRYSRVCGVDLGFMFEHRGKLEIMFGDTWQYASEGATPCSDPGVLGQNGRYDDDAQASFVGGTAAPSWAPPSAAVARPDGSSCPTVLDFDRTAQRAPYTFTPMRVRNVDGKDLNMGVLNTPLTAFSDGSTAFGLFGVGGVDDRRLYLARRDADVRTSYQVVADLGHDNNFQNPSAARTRSETDYTPPRGDEQGGALYLFGRPRFNTADNQTVDTNGVYLARAALPFYDPASGKSSFRAQYFSGLDATGAPTWSDTPSAGKPVFTRDFKLSNQIDVKYVPELGKWLMLYGGDAADGLNPPLVSDQPRHGAIHMRTAPHPWGPWSRPAPLLWREHAPWFLQCDAYDDTNPKGCDRKMLRAPYYSPGDWEPENVAFRGGACVKRHPKPVVMPNLAFPFPFCMSMSQRGNLYAANLVPTWTRQQPRDATSGLTTTTVYFVVSTWTPYAVILAAADLQLPDYRYGDLRLQVRDAKGALLRASEGRIATTRAAGGRQRDATTFVIHGPAGMQREPALGDRVALVSAARGAHVVAKGDAIQLGSVGTEWVLEPVTPSTSPGASVAPGGAAFRLRVGSNMEGAPQYLTSGSEGLRLTEAPSGEATFHFASGCTRGDACGAR